MAENNQGVINALKESQKEGAKVIADELKEGLSPITDTLLQPLKNISAGINSLPGVGMTKKLFSAVSTPLKDAFAADSKSNIEEQKAENEARREGEQNQTLMEDIRDGILGIQDGLIKGLSGLKDKGLMGLGILAGLIAAPFAALVAFFTQLGAEVKMLDKFMKGGLSKLFSPIIKFFDGVVDIFKGGPKDLKVFGKATDAITDFISGVKKIFKPITDGVGKILGFVKTSTAVMDGFAPVIKFAQGIGKVLGKIFLPITILMTLIDTVKGFMDGFKEDGLIGGIEGGITGLVNSIIGMPLDLLKKAVGFILGLFGFDNAKAALDSFSFQDLIKNLIGSIFDGLKGTFKFLTDLFDFSDTSPFAIFGKLVDIVFAPLNLAINFVKGIFGFGDPEEPFSFFGFITGLATKAINWVKGIFSFGDDVDGGESFLDIVMKPFKKAKAFFMDIFGFSDKSQEEIAASFNIIKIIGDAIDDIFNWFKGLLDIDINKIVDSIPGASTVLKALGIMEKSEEEKLAEKQQKIKDLQAQIETGSLMTVGFSDKDEREELAQLQKELNEMKAKQTGTTVINNYDNRDQSTSSSSATVTSTAMVDGAAVTGSQMN